jgi:hypothetical protein
MAQNVFSGYPGNGRKLLGELKIRGQHARHDYGIEMSKLCGMRCVYCDRDFKISYFEWLALEVDHVLPKYLFDEKKKLPEEKRWSKNWILDKANCAVCCSACNGFLSSFNVSDPPPVNEDAFFNIRDRVFEEKKSLAQKRHAEEKDYWEKNIK